MRVLVVDDDAVTRRMLESTLGDWGHEVETVGDGEEALERFREDPSQVMILDWLMPGELDGLDLCRRIRNQENDFYPYLIMLTSKDSREHLLEGLEAGADDYLTKPLDPPELKARLKIAARVRDLENRLQEKNRQLEEQNRRMSEDLQEAARIQRGLLPDHGNLPGEIDFAHEFRPSQKLGGDLYNLIQLDETHVAFYLLDVSGHGLPASLHSVAINFFLSSKVTELGIFKSDREDAPHYEINDPGEVVESLRHSVDPITRTGSYFTLSLAIMDLETLTASVLPAGCPPVLLVRADGTVEQVTGPSSPIGLMDEFDYESHRLGLEPGDKLVMYSDGLLEVLEEGDHAFEPDRLLNVLGSDRGVSAAELKQRIIASAELQEDLVDDLSLLIAGPSAQREPAQPGG